MRRATLPGSAGLRRRPLAGLPEVAEFTGLPAKTLYDQVHRKVGIGALAFKMGRYLRWDWNDIDAHIAQQKNGGTAA